MATWKRLILPNNLEVDVNLDLVLYIGRVNDVTSISFVGGPSDTGATRTLNVKEPPDEIHMKSALRSQK
jgi:hypothetical protein